MARRPCTVPVTENGLEGILGRLGGCCIGGAEVLRPRSCGGCTAGAEGMLLGFLFLRSLTIFAEVRILITKLF